MSSSAALGLDLIAIAILTFGLYFPRHRRRDLVVAYLAVNIGVLAVTQALSSVEVTAGLGLGLFGVLSIIRLRSMELNQQEVAYYFAALALGVLGGIPMSPEWLSPALMGALLVTIFVGDHPRLFVRYRVVEMVLEAAYTDEAVLVRRLEHLLGARVHRIAVRRVDLVNDTSTVEVRFELLHQDDATQSNRPHHEQVLP